MSPLSLLPTSIRLQLGCDPIRTNRFGPPIFVLTDSSPILSELLNQYTRRNDKFDVMKDMRAKWRKDDAQKV